MTLRPLGLILALLAVPAFAADSASAPSQQTSDTAPVRAGQPQRRTDRKPMIPLKPRVIEAPGAAMMMIPAAYAPVGGPSKHHPLFFRTIASR